MLILSNANLLKAFKKTPRAMIRSAALVLVSTLATSAFAVTPYSATYTFNLDNKATGTAVRKLSQKGDRWVYDFTAKVPVLASASEKSVFNLNNNQVISQSYQRQYKILVHQQNTSLQFNPSQKTISVQRDQKASQFTWQAGVLDDLNVEIQLREDLKKNSLKNSYLIADHRDITPRQFVKEGTAKITTASGTYDTVKVRINHKDKQKVTTFWLAPALDYLPVQMSHSDEGSVYTLSLTNYKPA